MRQAVRYHPLETQFLKMHAFAKLDQSKSTNVRAASRSVVNACINGSFQASTHTKEILVCLVISDCGDVIACVHGDKGHIEGWIQHRNLRLHNLNNRAR